MADKYDEDRGLRIAVCRKWVENLRSGKYKQGRLRLAQETLKSNGEVLYCCLGVLCESIIELGIYSLNKEESYETYYGDYTVGDLNERKLKLYRYHGSKAELPYQVRRFMNMESDCGEVCSVGELVRMNDQQYETFNEIADFIESRGRKRFGQLWDGGIIIERPKT